MCTAVGCNPDLLCYRAKPKTETISCGYNITTKTLLTDLTMDEDWELSIDLKLPQQSIANVFSIQDMSSDKDIRVGSRLPGVWIKEADLITRYHINDNWNHAYDTADFEKDKWFTLKGRDFVKRINKLKLFTYPQTQTFCSCS